MTKVLDHGSVELIETWGSDERIIEAARMSTDKGFEGWGPKPCPQCSPGTLVWGSGMVNLHVEGQYIGRECPTCKGTGKVPGDEKLLKYLYSHKHMTPFEMGGLTIEVQAPIFVFREWHRHRTQSYNEMSARYTPLPDVNYMPSLTRCMSVSSTNKQAQSNLPPGGVPLSAEAALEWLEKLDELYVHAQDVYRHGLHIGIPKEVARLPVPVARYTRMRASANLRNWLAFLTLRMDPAAQWEIRMYADAVATLILEKFPRTYQLFVVG